jgi:Uma2 family endonuclease
MTATAPTATQKQLTYEEYLEEFRTQPPTPQPSYILDGVKIMSPSPRPIHQIITDNFLDLIREFRRAGGAVRAIPAPMDVVIRRVPLRTRQPDILVISEERYRQSGVPDMDGPITVAPELIVEVLSPSETRRSIEEKVADFQVIGVQECWLVSPEAETVEILALTPAEIRPAAHYSRGQDAESIVFPDLRLPVASIFER